MLFTVSYSYAQSQEFDPSVIKGSEQEKDEIKQFGNAMLIVSLLPVLDDLERLRILAPDGKTVWTSGDSSACRMGGVRSQDNIVILQGRYFIAPIGAWRQGAGKKLDRAASAEAGQFPLPSSYSLWRGLSKRGKPLLGI
jgi:hypothetical protein